MVALISQNDDPTPFCLQRLEEHLHRIDQTNITAAESRRLMVELTACFIEVGRDVGRMKVLLSGLQKNEVSKKDSDIFRAFLIWFSDKVLPSLVTSAIVALVLWIAAVNGLLG